MCVCVCVCACVCVCVCVCVCAGAHLVEVSDWPEAELQLGQVSGLALNSNGDLIIFHRGDHIWGIKYVMEYKPTPYI